MRPGAEPRNNTRVLRSALKSQYRAALAMLKEAIERCPADAWLDDRQDAWLACGQEDCPEHYKEHEDFWRQTVQAVPFEGLQGLDGGDFSLGLAIDLLWTCHWNFVENLQLVLEVIGGNLEPERPFAACAWNITLSPIRPRMKVVSNTLEAFCGDPESDKEIDRDVLSMLGEPTAEKQWLAASLDKTIRLQLKL